MLEVCSYLILNGNTQEAVKFYQDALDAELIEQSVTPTIGKMRENIYNFYHPRPQLKTSQDKYQKCIKEQYDNIFKNK